MLETITLENAVKFSVPVAKKIFKNNINPIIENKISKYIKTSSGKRRFEAQSVKYISSVAGLCSTINTIAFPNTPKRLDDLYLPLTVVGESGKIIEIDDDSDIFKYGKKVLVNDTAGMGKSTLSKKVILNIIKKQEYIPVFIELRQLESKPIAIQLISKLGVNTDLSSEFLNQLPLVYVFDGLDEVAVEDKINVVKELRKFIDSLDDAMVLITSRLESYLSEFYDFTRYSIEPLSEQEAFDLISKYDPKGDVANKLISGIKRSSDHGLREFLSTPLYVSLLFCAYRHKTVIPQKKHLFYSQVYEALFESHDLSKEIGFVRPKYSKLDSSEFHTLLRRLAFWCLKNGGKLEFQKDELEIIVQDIIEHANGINTSSASFVKDLTTTVPIFVKEGSNVRWSHKSLMEYFSSMFICNDAKNKQQDLLLYLYSSKEWSSYRNIFELCADIDFSSMRSSVVKNVLEKYLKHYEDSYNEITNKRIKREDVEFRIAISFSKDLGFRILNNMDFEKLEDIFWTDKNPDVINVKTKCKADNHQVAQFVTGVGVKGHFIHGVILTNKEDMIVNILSHKCAKLMLKNDRRRDNFKEIVSDTSLKMNKLYIVTDEPTNILNNSKCFKVVNDIFSVFSGNALSIDEVRKELLNIDDDSSNGIDKLIGNIV